MTKTITGNSNVNAHSHLAEAENSNVHAREHLAETENPNGAALHHLAESENTNRHAHGDLSEIENSNVKANLHLAETEKPNRAALHDLAEATLGGVEIVLPTTEIELWELATSELNRSGIHAARAGYVLKVLKERVAHGEFIKELDKRGIDETDSRRCMQIASALMALTPEQQKKLTNLGKTRLLALVKLPPETLEDLADGSHEGGVDLDDIAAMPTRQLQAYTRQLRLELSNAKMEVELAQAVTLPKPKTLYPALVMAVREEGSIATQRANLCLDEMERLIGQLAAPDAELDSGEAGKAQFSAAATTLYTSIAAIYGRAAHLLKLYKTYGWEDYEVNRPEDLVLISADEAKALHERWRLMVQASTQEREYREAQRKRNKRGRPKGSTHKAETK